MLYTRRDLGKFALAALPAAAFLEETLSATSLFQSKPNKPNSKFNGVQIGTLAYNSWISMQARKETDPNTCAFNDLALIKISAGQVANVNPTVPFWGGPNALADLLDRQFGGNHRSCLSAMSGGMSAPALPSVASLAGSSLEAAAARSAIAAR